MTYDECQRAMEDAGIFCLAATITEDVFMCPTRDWFYGTFAKGLGRHLNRLGLSSYIRERNDCDDFAIHAMSYARICHFRSTKAHKGIAVGMFAYNPDGDPTRAHAINFAIVREGGIYRPIFLEPNGQRPVEIGSRDAARFYMI